MHKTQYQNTLTVLANCKKTTKHQSTPCTTTQYQNTLTGMANCKKTTKHQSPNQDFFSKFGSVTFPPLQFPNLMQKIRKILRAISEKTALPTNQPNIKVSDFGLIWRRLCEYFQIKNVFQKSGSVIFLSLWSSNFMQKNRKTL